MIKLVALVSGITGQGNTQAAEGVVVHRGEDDCGMGFTVLQLRKLAQGPGCVVVGGGGNGQGNEYFIGVQARVMVAQVFALQVLYGLDNFRGDQVGFLRDAGQLLQRVQDRRGGRSEQVRGLAGDDLAVGQLNGQGGMTGGFCS